MRIKNTALAGAAVTALALAAPAQADLSFQAGDWTVAFDGNVNTFYMITDCESPDGAANVEGGLACVDGNGSKDHNIRTGLLPAKLGFSASTRQNGFDVEAYVSYWPGTSSGGLLTGDDRTGAFGFGEANFRQVYFSFGNETMGTVKMGRDLGVFGSDAILNDMTIMGAGTVSNATLTGGNTTLGRIGTGYIYADFKAQVQYQTPDFNGLQATVALSDPFTPSGLSGQSLNATGGTPNGSVNNDRPAIEGKITYDFATADGMSGRLWIGGIQQRVRGELVATGENASHSAYAGEVGISAGVGPISGVAYYYQGKGIGTTGQLLDGYSVEGNRERDSDGFYIQGMYEVPVIGSKLGLSYGESNLDDVSGDTGYLVEKNKSWIGGIYHPLTPNLTLVAEYTRTKAENQNGDSNREHNVALGGIIFF